MDKKDLNVNRKDDLEVQFMNRLKEQDINVSRADIKVITTEFIEAMKDCIYDREGLSLIGFCDFIKQYKEAYICRNPKTGEQMVCQPKTTVKVKLAKRIKNLS